MKLQLAVEIITAAINEAHDIEQPMNVAVVDASNNLMSFARMDGAWLNSIEIAIAKAKTANGFDTDTHNLGNLAQPGDQFYGIQNVPGVIIFAGGVVLRDLRGARIGAIGVSGGLGEEDLKVARAGAYYASQGFGINE